MTKKFSILPCVLFPIMLTFLMMTVSIIIMMTTLKYPIHLFSLPVCPVFSDLVNLTLISTYPLFVLIKTGIGASIGVACVSVAVLVLVFS